MVSVPTVVGVGSPVILILVPLVVDVLGIVVRQGFQVSAPLVGVEDAVDNAAAACRLCRIRRGVAVPRRHAPIPVGPARHRSGFENLHNCIGGHGVRALCLGRAVRFIIYETATVPQALKPGTGTTGTSLHSRC